MNSFKFIFYIFFFFLINLSFSYGNEKVRFINLEFLFENTNLGKSISFKLNELNNKNLEKLKLDEKKLIDKDNEIKKTQNILSEDELKIKIKNLNEELKIFNDNKNEIITSFNDEKNKQLNGFFDKINPIIQQYLDQKSITLLLDKKNIFIGKSNIDITDDILKIINDKFK